MDELHEDETGIKQQYQAEQIRKESGLKEEYGAELTPSVPLAPRAVHTAEHQKVVRQATPIPFEEESDVQASPSRTIGFIAILLAVASLFVWPALLGSVAVILGIFAWMKGSKALGAWSIILGLISVTAYFVLIPLYA
jgi:hypothetical protein